MGLNDYPGSSHNERVYRDASKPDQQDIRIKSKQQSVRSKESTCLVHIPQKNNSDIQQEKQQVRDKEWAQREIPDHDLVDIQHLVEHSRSPIIPLIRNTHEAHDTHFLKKIGRWGEEFVYTVLQRRGELPNGQNIEKIVWVNEFQESGKPYDIEVDLKTGKNYIEVKSTVADKKDLVPFSWNELKFAEEKLHDYHLYRVYNAGKSSYRLCQLENLNHYLKNKPMRLLFYL